MNFAFRALNFEYFGVFVVWVVCLVCFGLMVCFFNLDVRCLIVFLGLFVFLLSCLFGCVVQVIVVLL